MAFWDYNYDLGVWLYLPVRRRVKLMVAWLRALVSQAKYINSLFKTYRSNNLYALGLNGQVCFLEKALNDVFDDTLRRIYIDDGVLRDADPLFLRSESQPLFIDLRSEIGTGVIADPDPVPLFTEAEVDASGIEFIIHMPVALVYDTTRLRALVNLYKLPGTQYAVTTP